MKMKKRMSYISAAVIIFLLVACASPSDSNGVNAPVQDQGPVEGNDNTAPPQVEEEPMAAPVQEEELEPADCLGGETSPIAQSIADQNESASYEDVMTWFCNGAEFEDILIALQTESQTDTPAQDMLEMLADGFTWEEIWLVVGLTE